MDRTRSWYHAALVRAACVLLLAIALPLCVACAETTNGPLVGASDAWTSAPEPTPASPNANANATRAVWEGYAELQRMPSANPVAFMSRGHQPEHQVDIRVNEVARPSYTGLVTDTVFPDGSQLVELPHGGAGHAYVMRKNAGIWSYMELDPRGVLLAAGPLELCAGCHAQAPSDHAFGLPRGP